MNKPLIALVMVILLVGLAYLYLVPAGEPVISLKTYVSSSGDLTFNYPADYVLEERAAAGGERGEQHLTLIQESELKSGASEGPTSITIDIYQNDLDKLTTEQWIKNDARSNFKLSPDGKLSSTPLSRRVALTYIWDGLYRGETVALATNKNVYAFSVTTLTAEDQIKSDFEALLKTVDIKE